MIKIIAIEGPDKVGKETQTKALYLSLFNQGFKVKRVEVPIHDLITYKLIYWMLRNGLAKKLPAFFQFVQFVNKFMWQLFVLPFYLFKYDYLILDRWSLSSIVYGKAENLPMWYMLMLYNLLFKPRLTIVLNGKSYKRNTADDVYEKDSNLQRLVRENYRDFGLALDKMVLIDNQGTISEIHNRIKEVLP